MKKWLWCEHVARWYQNPDEWMYEINHRDGEFSFIKHFITEFDGKPVGFCQYYEYVRGGENWHEGTDITGAYSIDYLIGEKSHIGLGLGKMMIVALTDMIFKKENAMRVIVKPDVNNAASCAALLSAGFVYDDENKLYILNCRN